MTLPGSTAHLKTMNVTEAVAYVRGLGLRVEGVPGKRGRYRVFCVDIADKVLCEIYGGERCGWLSNPGAVVIQEVLPYYMGRMFKGAQLTLETLHGSLINSVMAEAPELKEDGEKHRRLAGLLALALRDVFPAAADVLAMEAR